MTQSRTPYLGMAVHTDAMAVASVAQEHPAEVVSLGQRGTRQGDSEQLCRRLPSHSPPLVLVSAAGPCGSWLSRSRTQTGPGCWVVAPSLSPQKSGDRVKPHRRDAITLARLLRSGALTPVSVPPVEDAAMRALGRARAETLDDRKAAQWRRKAVLLRHASRSTGRATWSPAHLRWLSAVGCPPPGAAARLPRRRPGHDGPPAHRPRLEPARHDQGHPWRLALGGAALQALRGVPCPRGSVSLDNWGPHTCWAWMRSL
jgi:transposase